MEHIFSNTLTLSELEGGNSIKVPLDILNLAGFTSGEVVRFEIANEKIVISRDNLPQKETLESLFKNYDGLPFKTDVIDLGGPVGEEKW